MPIESDEELGEVLSEDVVAVIGCSTTPGKDAHEIPKYLHDRGYEVLPVNPGAEEVFDRPAYDSLADVDEEIEIVDEALAREDDSVIWTQLGVRDDDAVARAEESGLRVVQDRCMKVEHSRLR